MMLLTLRFLGIFCIIREIYAGTENKNDKINNTSSDNDLKNEFGCLPLEKWNLMRVNYEAVKLVCVSDDYEIGQKPKEIAMHPIFAELEKSRIVDIDENKKTITMDIRLLCFWRDERIKAVFPKNSGVVMLPPVTSIEKPEVWNPFQWLEFGNLIDRRFILDPIAMKIGLGGSETANTILDYASETTLFPVNSSVVWSRIYWRVTVSCSFNFSTFPFDKQECYLIMDLPFNWNLTLHSETEYTAKYHADGFEIQSYEFGPIKGYDKLLGTHSTLFGVVFEAKRHVSKYILQYYLPSITIVMASSVSFIIPLSAIPGRVALVVTQFLTLTNIFIHQMVYAMSFSEHKM